MTSVLSACGGGGGGGSGATAAGSDAASLVDGDQGAAGNDVGTSNTPAVVGLDRRPANASCVAPAEPDSGEVREQAVYVNLPFAGALLNLEQARGDGRYWYTHTRDGRIYRFSADGDGSDALL
ncbi:MAG: hypothetical protein R3E87_23310, partial [Burkholderiaceae bacterium]